MKIFYHSRGLAMCGTNRELRQRLDDLCRQYPRATVRELIAQTTYSGRVVSLVLRAAE